MSNDLFILKQDTLTHDGKYLILSVPVGVCQNSRRSLSVLEGDREFFFLRMQQVRPKEYDLQTSCLGCECTW